MPKRRVAALLTAVAAASLCAGGCSPLRAARTAALTSGFEERLVRTEPFLLQTYYRSSAETGELAVYIEGDGLAWLTPTQPSPDPTPTDPIGLKLAVADTSGAPVLYIGRPCQYVRRIDAACSITVWTTARFSDAVVSAVGAAIDTYASGLKKRAIRLVGYSGGGVVGALLSVRRREVGQLITIAAPLDHATWTDTLGLTPLASSLNPIDFASDLSRVDQVHYVGAEDEVVPGAIIDRYLRALDESASAGKIVVEGFDHACCWVREWPALLAALRDRR